FSSSLKYELKTFSMIAKIAHVPGTLNRRTIKSSILLLLLCVRIRHLLIIKLYIPASIIKSTMKVSAISRYLKDSLVVILSIKFMLFNEISQERHDRRLQRNPVFGCRREITYLHTYSVWWQYSKHVLIRCII